MALKLNYQTLHSRSLVYRKFIVTHNMSYVNAQDGLEVGPDDAR